MNGFWLSLTVCVISLAALVRLLFGVRRMKWLTDVAIELPQPPPRVSVIFSALNEESTLEPALRSLLSMDYPNLEIVAVNDRSTDGTGAILDRAAATDARLRVIHIKALPAGWLGKNHALQRAGEAATGDWLLFTDADVVFERSALQRAVSYCETEALDHFAVVAEFIAKGAFLQSVLLNFYSFMFITHAPWRVRTNPKAYIGIGAFNMVRASSYRQAGAHEPLRMEVVDDICLGKLMKAKGYRQDSLYGLGSAQVEWYRSPGELMRGLEKNSFAMANYNLAMVVGPGMAGLVGHYWPIVGLFITQGASWWLNVTTVVASVLIHVKLLTLTRYRASSLLWWPLGAGFLIYVTSRGVLLTLMRGGISWRGTQYPLAELKAARERMGR